MESQLLIMGGNTHKQLVPCNYITLRYAQFLGESNAGTFGKQMKEDLAFFAQSHIIHGKHHILNKQQTKIVLKDSIPMELAK